jgi:FixJ family two-component response regulator
MTNGRMSVSQVVYVVDDEASIKLSLKALLGTWGISVIVFSSAADFWNSYRGEWTGCVLVDLRMPGESGLALLTELKQRRCDLIAILMTGHGEDESHRHAIECGAVGILEKPFRASQLKELLEHHRPELFRGVKSTSDP